MLKSSQRIHNITVIVILVDNGHNGLANVTIQRKSCHQTVTIPRTCDWIKG